MKISDLTPRLVRPLGNDTERSVEAIQLPNVTKEEAAMPSGVYDRKPRGSAAAKKDVATPPSAKKTRGEYATVLADLRKKRKQIDAAISAIEAL